MTTIQCPVVRELPWLLSAKQVRVHFGLNKRDIAREVRLGRLHRHGEGRKGKYFKSELILLARVPHSTAEG